MFGCGTHAKLAAVDPHAGLVEGYLATAAALGAPIVAVFEAHVQADHVSGLPELEQMLDEWFGIDQPVATHGNGLGLFLRLPR